MTDEEGCPHGLEPEWCSTCKHGPARPAAVTWGRFAYPARYPGRCPECNEAFDPGEAIVRKTTGDHDQYAHEACAPARP